MRFLVVLLLLSACAPKHGTPGLQGSIGIQGPAGSDGKDGSNGSDGASGRDGVNGLNGHSVVTKVEPATTCDGTLVTLALDLNDNWQHDADDLTLNTFTVCNGRKGESCKGKCKDKGE